MDGGEPGGVGREVPPEDAGSVGDWALPSWVHRVPGTVWLFIGLALVDLGAQYLARIRLTQATGLDPWTVLGLVASSAPVVLPAGVAWASRAAAIRKRSDLLLVGSIAIAFGELLRTAAYVLLELTAPDLAVNDARPPYVQALRLVALACSVIGPILLARAILRARVGRPPRWAIGLGLAVGALTAVYVGQTLRGIADGFAQLGELDDQALADPFRTELALAGLSALVVIGWAYLTWSVFSAAGDGGHPARARRAGIAAMLFHQGVTAVSLLRAVATPVSTPETDPNGEALLAFYTATFQAAVILSIAASASLLVALALGLGRAWDDDLEDAPDDGAVELEPVPIPGSTVA